ncbi:MAG TPA: ribosome assembly factor SBDS [Bacillota bacterium]|nr:ribosome assembly factor SBDS [Bacillota bacterium]
MTDTIARIKKTGKNFEIIVNLDKALKFKKGDSSANDFLETETIFTDSKKGFKAKDQELEDAFGTTDANTIAQKIVKDGEILLTQEHRDEEKDKKIRQIVDFLSQYTIDPTTKNPHTATRIENALKEANVSVKNVPIENQIKDIIASLSSILPIKMESKKLGVTVPAIYTGPSYNILKPHIQNETWLNNGDLRVILDIPSGLQSSFYDKLNSLTHGSVITEEIKENEG